MSALSGIDIALWDLEGNINTAERFKSLVDTPTWIPVF